MSRIRLFVLPLCLGLAIATFGCGGSSPTTPPSPVDNLKKQVDMMKMQQEYMKKMKPPDGVAPGDADKKPAS